MVIDFNQDLEGIVWDGQEIMQPDIKPREGLIAGVGNSIYLLEEEGKKLLYAERPYQVNGLCVVDGLLYATLEGQITVEDVATGKIEYIQRDGWVESIVPYKDGVLDCGDYAGMFEWKHMPNSSNTGSTYAQGLDGMKSPADYKGELHVLSNKRILNIPGKKFIDGKHYNCIGVHHDKLLAADKPHTRATQDIYVLDIRNKMVHSKKVLAKRKEVTHALISFNDDLLDATGSKVYSTTKDLKGKRPLWKMPDVVHSLAVVPMDVWELMAQGKVRV